MLFDKILGVLWGMVVIVRDLVFARQEIFRKSGLYMTRWHPLGWPSRALSRTGLFPNIYLQHFHQGDDWVPHNHPRFFLSLILRGGYVETRLTPRRDQRKYLRLPWRWNWITPDTFHYVELLNKRRGCWTLVLVGPTLWRKWGFWVGGRIMGSSEYKKRMRLGPQVSATAH